MGNLCDSCKKVEADDDESAPSVVNPINSVSNGEVSELPPRYTNSYEDIIDDANARLLTRIKYRHRITSNADELRTRLAAIPIDASMVASPSLFSIMDRNNVLNGSNGVSSNSGSNSYEQNMSVLSSRANNDPSTILDILTEPVNLSSGIEDAVDELAGIVNTYLSANSTYQFDRSANSSSTDTDNDKDGSIVGYLRPLSIN